jgi:diaminopimelate decarboxylase
MEQRDCWQPRKIHGSDLLDLARYYGTPLYVYDGERIFHQYKRFVQAFDSRIPLEVKYACKALLSLAVIELMHHYG